MNYSYSSYYYYTHKATHTRPHRADWCLYPIIAAYSHYLEPIFLFFTRNFLKHLLEEPLSMKQFVSNRYSPYFVFPVASLEIHISKISHAVQPYQIYLWTGLQDLN